MSTIYAQPPAAAQAVLPAIQPSYVNPAHMQNSLPGPSKKPPKRKRTDTTDDDTSNTDAHRKARDGPKKKKANRACFHCQKAHLTCDDSRPCQRCIKRGIATNCTEGHRKKAKYLLDEQELGKSPKTAQAGEVLGSRKQYNRTTFVSFSPRSPHSHFLLSPASAPETFNPSDSMLNVSFDPNFTFGSEAANLEYSILSAILGNPSPTDSATSPPPPSSHYPWVSTADSIDYPSSPRLSSTPYTTSSTFAADSSGDNNTSPVQATHYLAYPYHSELSYPQYTSPQQRQDVPLHPLQPRYPLDARPRSPPASIFLSDPAKSKPQSQQQESGLLSPPPSNASPVTTNSIPPSLLETTSAPPTGSKLQSIHNTVTAPYDYTEGYHFLMKHLPSRFEKNDILRIVRALAIFRPSLIALQMPLSLDDEVFVEKCFQRSLLELDKLISFSGTPTVVWRRTGEICLVAPEFCMLTEWPMEELMGGKKYIYELFENQSVVEYWENFAEHAFENTTQSVYSHCVLLKPDGAPVPATFCFSIRRDLFDLPSIVIGVYTTTLAYQS
ncbi:hypothetical protein BD779DRAFT_1467603 [Infundibulicybe gibba]|nr:hypothetical protein BD779DRAFT_1467603 [Infundibulicybe gibba]